MMLMEATLAEPSDTLESRLDGSGSTSQDAKAYVKVLVGHYLLLSVIQPPFALPIIKMLPQLGLVTGTIEDCDWTTTLAKAPASGYPEAQIMSGCIIEIWQGDLLRDTLRYGPCSVNQKGNLDMIRPCPADR